MRQSPVSQQQNTLEKNTPSNIRGAYVFDKQEADRQPAFGVKPAQIVTDFDSIDISDEPLDDAQPLQISEKLTPKKAGKKWMTLLFAAVLLASGAELIFFIMAMVETMDWLAGVWLIIFSVIGMLILRQIFIEVRGLKQLKKQENVRSQSERIANTSVIGLAEQHCLNIAKTLPYDYQNLLVNWRETIESHHSDNEILCLFEHQVLAPIDKIAIKQVSNNASAASVMIAVSPFALLDMLIVLWRNIRMMNQVSEIYGLRLGYWGRISLIRKIFHTMLYAGAAEILSDAGNYALGAGIAGKLSTRVAQGMGAGVLTARIGLKVINESRPLPWLSQTKPGLSGISKQLLTDLNKQLR